eukprot:4502874-Pleurochrysis_carterae.AAC.1
MHERDGRLRVPERTRVEEIEGQGGKDRSCRSSRAKKRAAAWVSGGEGRKAPQGSMGCRSGSGMGKPNLPFGKMRREVAWRTGASMRRAALRKPQTAPDAALMCTHPSNDRRP